MDMSALKSALPFSGVGAAKPAQRFYTMSLRRPHRCNAYWLGRSRSSMCCSDSIEQFSKAVVFMQDGR